jgi:hypothetical protein
LRRCVGLCRYPFREALSPPPRSVGRRQASNFPIFTAPPEVSAPRGDRQVHDVPAERYLENFVEGNVRPYRLMQVVNRFEDVVSAERHVRSHSDPLLHRPFGRFARRPVPLVVLAVGPKQLHRPQTQYTPTIDCVRYSVATLNSLGSCGAVHEVYLVIFLDLDGSRGHAIARMLMHAHEVLLVRLSHRRAG